MLTRPALTLLALAACSVQGAATDTDTGGSASTDMSSTTGSSVLAGWPESVGACVGEPAAPTRLLVTTTDFSTGGVSVVKLAGLAATPDIALGSADARPFFFGDLAIVLHRFGVSAFDLLDPTDNFRLLAQRGVVVDGVVDANPHALVVGPDDRAYISLFGAPAVQVWDLGDRTAPVLETSFDLSPLADADGNPEASDVLLCGDVLFVALDRVDQTAGFDPVDPVAQIAAIDTRSGALYDSDPDAEGVQPFALLGPWARQIRLDPADSSGRTALVLTSGVERLDLTSGTSSWAVAESRLRAAGLDDYRLPQAFDLGPGGTDVYIAAYRADFSEAAIFRAALDRDEPLVEIAAGLQSVEQSLEIVGDRLYFGDRGQDATGMRAWDLKSDPPTLVPDTPVVLGLAPYAAVAIP